MFFKMVMQKQDRDSERTQFCDMLRLGSRDGVGCHKVWLKKENPLIIKGIVIANVINRTCSRTDGFERYLIPETAQMTESAPISARQAT